MRTEHIKDGWWEMPGHLIGEIWPGTKNAKDHRVWLPKPVLDIIAEIEPEPGFAFTNEAGNAIDKLDGAMRDICQALGVENKVTPHDLRRTRCSTVTGLASAEMRWTAFKITRMAACVTSTA